MSDAKEMNWDLIVKVVGLIALIASGTWTLYSYRDNRKIDLLHQQESDSRETKARLQELNKYVFEKQASLYFDAAESAATIAMTRDPAAKKAAIEKFYRLYFGQLVVVEDRRVELAMIQFSRCIDVTSGSCTRTVTTDQKAQSFSSEKLESLPTATLDNLSLELAACARSALKIDRGIDFGKLVDPISTCPYD